MSSSWIWNNLLCVAMSERNVLNNVASTIARVRGALQSERVRIWKMQRAWLTSASAHCCCCRMQRERDSSRSLQVREEVS